MHKVSKTTRKSTLAPTPRFKPMWFVPDRGGLSINECVEKRLSKDMCSNGAPRSGKTCSQCKFHSRFPDYKMCPITPPFVNKLEIIAMTVKLKCIQVHHNETKTTQADCY